MAHAAASGVPGSRRPSAEAVALDDSEHSDRRFCSWQQSGWRSVLLRSVDNNPVVEEVEIPATSDQLLVLVTRGRAVMEVADGRRWRRADYSPGRLAMTAPGQSTRLRWRTTSDERHRTLHLYLPGAAMREMAQQVWDRDVDVLSRLDALATYDPVVDATMRAMADAAAAGADDLYAESALHFLSVHLCSRLIADPALRAPAPGDTRVSRAIEFMHENLAVPLSLADMAATVDLSVYHFVRVFRAGTGEPPRQFLTRLRIEAARRHLERGDLPVSDVAYLCGFSSPSHLAAAFRRRTGCSPTAYRAGTR